ncbi:type IV pilus modification protein PilV [Variovorax sp. KK3]|uniref:type IV pilus modification protein PilV n=1 Tax=Variovorax sp. KK3 TaxID=1855728 RepID=UPI003AAF20E0
MLIATLVLSFGMLGLAGLAAGSQRYAKMAQFQSVGVALAADLGERMRGNIAGFQSGLYARTEAYSKAAPSAKACADKSLCTPGELASIDMAQWLGDVLRRLPEGGAYVQRDTVNPLATDIWLIWIDPKQATDLSVARDDDCPANALKGRASSEPKPRCMYYRISL